MRLIEHEMLNAIRTGKDWYKDNTSVEHANGLAIVRLHGNRIATIHARRLVVIDELTLRQWPTPTTKSRLRAMRVPVYTDNHATYIGNQTLDNYEFRTFTLHN